MAPAALMSLYVAVQTSKAWTSHIAADLALVPLVQGRHCTHTHIWEVAQHDYFAPSLHFLWHPHLLWL